MPLLTFKGLPENIEWLKKTALWGNSLIYPCSRYPLALSLCWAGNSGEQDRCGPVLMDLPVWCYLSSRIILGLSFLLLLGLGALPLIWLHSLACHQRIQGVEGEQKPGRHLKSEQWIPWHIFKYYFFNQQGHSHLFTCLHQGPVPWQPKQLFCQGEKSPGGK